MKTIRLAVLLGLLFGVHAIRATDAPPPTEVYERNESGGPPITDDLSRQLTLATVSQRYNDCHVTAAMDLFEAACYRATGHHVRLSESFLFYRFLRSQVARARPYEWYHRDQTPSELTTFDEGEPDITLRHILDGNVCTDTEQPHNPAFDALLRQRFTAAKSQANDATQINLGTLGLVTLLGGTLGSAAGLTTCRIRGESCKHVWGCLLKPGLVGTALAYTGKMILDSHEGRVASERTLDEFGRDLDQAAARLLEAQPAAEPGGEAYCHTADPNLRQCLDVLQKRYAGQTFQTHDVDSVAIRALLDRHIPVACTGNYHESEGDGAHVAVIIGYRYRKDAPGGIEYRIRNTHGYPAQWFATATGGCRDAYWLE